ncbi:hypothetical protein [Streptomyces fagopyri]|uniref:hypothetical protein n=1 Tax=Streptomyces fagopyri TaxID=2662397 RepID=UPI0033C5EC76
MLGTALIRCGVGALLAASSLSACSTGHDGSKAGAGSSLAAPATRSGATGTTPSEPSPTPTEAGATAGTPVAEVRDSFAVLQATYNDGCDTPGNCAYFLDRVAGNLDDLYDSMKASPKGPSHFSDPIKWIAHMRTTLHGDFSYTHLKQHKSLLTGTRDKVNTWMQSHPDDYR